MLQLNKGIISQTPLQVLEKLQWIGAKGINFHRNKSNFSPYTPSSSPKNLCVVCLFSPDFDKSPDGRDV